MFTFSTVVIVLSALFLLFIGVQMNTNTAMQSVMYKMIPLVLAFMLAAIAWSHLV